SRVPISKSWDRIFLRLRVANDSFFAEYKTWYRLPEKDKEYPADPEGDDNPDIHEYYGYGELHLRLTFGQAELGIFGRFNPKTEKGAVQLDFTYPAPGNAALWYLQYWNGYGESLIDYNQSLIKFGLGIMVKR
ncbi:phospholipase A, partial [bacterium]|nr:phospholipase A [bacterium]